MARHKGEGEECTPAVHVVRRHLYDSNLSVHDGIASREWALHVYTIKYHRLSSDLVTNLQLRFKSPVLASSCSVSTTHNPTRAHDAHEV